MCEYEIRKMVEILLKIGCCKVKEMEQNRNFGQLNGTLEVDSNAYNFVFFLNLEIRSS